MDIKLIFKELKEHSPLTFLGALSGSFLLLVLTFFDVSSDFSNLLFSIFHPLHVLLSAFATVSTFNRNGGKFGLKMLAIGYFGSVGICTISDCIIPYIGEWMLELPNRGLHFHFIEHWWLVNPLAFLGIFLGFKKPVTRLPHFFHVFISTWASLFHISMSITGSITILTYFVITGFLFFSVIIPCCASDIVFPLCFFNRKKEYPKLPYYYG